MSRTTDLPPSGVTLGAENDAAIDPVARTWDAARTFTEEGGVAMMTRPPTEMQGAGPPEALLPGGAHRQPGHGQEEHAMGAIGLVILVHAVQFLVRRPG